MAYTASTLTKVAELGLARTLWSYWTTDAAGTVDTAAYFTGDAVKMLRVGDLILRTTVDSITAPTSVTSQGFHTVSSNDGTTVDVNDTLAVTATDTD